MTVNFNGQQENVNLQMSKPPTTVETMRDLLVPTPTGIVVKLSDVATVTAALGPTQISHIAGVRTATVSATATTNNVGGVTMELQKQIDALKGQLPTGVTVATAGVGQNQAQAFSSLGLALLVAIILVYVVMVGTFRSLLQPLVLLVSIPFAATGSLLLMLATHTPLVCPR